MTLILRVTFWATLFGSFLLKENNQTTFKRLSDSSDTQTELCL